MKKDDREVHMGLAGTNCKQTLFNLITNMECN